jgi:hypothetical protein
MLTISAKTFVTAVMERLKLTQVDERFEVFGAMKILIVVFCVVMYCCLHL